MWAPCWPRLTYQTSSDNSWRGKLFINRALSLVPRLIVGGGKRAWYLLFAHAHNYPLLNTCLGKSERGTRNTFPCEWWWDICKFTKYTCIVACSEERNKFKQPYYSLNYIGLICYNFLLTYSLWQTVTQWESHRLRGCRRINTYFSAKIQLIASCTFLRLKWEVLTCRRQLESAGELTIDHRR